MAAARRENVSAIRIRAAAAVLLMGIALAPAGALGERRSEAGAEAGAAANHGVAPYVCSLHEPGGPAQDRPPRD